MIQELWRCAYVKDAYEDQTGAKHWGYVVYERTIVVSTDRTFPMKTGYNISGEETAGRIWIRPSKISVSDARVLQGDEFWYYPNMIDYVGGGSWRNHTNPDDQGKERGWWKKPPIRLRRYVYPDGTPAKRVLDDEPE